MKKYKHTKLLDKFLQEAAEKKAALCDSLETSNDDEDFMRYEDYSAYCELTANDPFFLIPSSSFAPLNGSDCTLSKEKSLWRKVKYVGHNTTTKGALVLIFEGDEDGEECTLFFNVDTRLQRGPNAGAYRKTGKGGHFYPPSRGKFRKFWKKIVGAGPRKWALAHKELRARLKDKEFHIRTEARTDSKGKGYLKIVQFNGYN